MDTSCTAVMARLSRSRQSKLTLVHVSVTVDNSHGGEQQVEVSEK